MTLKHKFLLRNALMVVMLLLLGAASLWGLWGLRRQVDLALIEYSNLQTIESAESQASTARALFVAQPTDISKVIDSLRAVQTLARSFGSDPQAEQVYEKEKRLADYVAVRCEDAIGKLQDSGDPAQVATATRDEVIGTIDAMLGDMHLIASACQDFIQKSQAGSTLLLRQTMWTMGILSLAAVFCAAVISVSQYRLVLAPLHKLRQGVRNVAAKRFTERVDASGGAEFADLANEFNSMAGELDGLYRELEAKVAAKSKELVRSERLASVGFLAAGVAHEINNPLSIISGYAELSLKSLLDSKDDDPQSISEAAQGLRIIRDEAFRCKEITEKLLSLAKSGTRNKEPFSLAQLAEEVISIIRGLQTYRDRRVHLGIESTEPLTVYGNPNEIKQVLLNLTINALEATPPQRGEVCVAAKRVAEWVELEVRDNGRGMPADVVDHVFEPFFTAKRGVGEPGTGLGLSISHAIIESHGGQVSAQSEGLGRGSRFVIRLPAARQMV